MEIVLFFIISLAEKISGYTPDASLADIPHQCLTLAVFYISRDVRFRLCSGKTIIRKSSSVLDVKKSKSLF